MCRMLKKEKKAAERERRLKERELTEKEGKPWPVKRKRLDKDVGRYAVPLPPLGPTWELFAPTLNYINNNIIMILNFHLPYLLTLELDICLDLKVYPAEINCTL